MAYELVYTSAPAGVRPGSSGFCVVACTAGIPAALSGQLEKLSAYKPYFPEYDEMAAENPVACAHLVSVSGGHTYHLLSRICHNGLDYTGRSNKLASHLALTRQETQSVGAGPAAMFLCPGLFREADWQIKAESYQQPPMLPQADFPVGVAKTWQQVTGDAGWAGVLAEAWQADKSAIVYLVFDPRQPVPAVQMIHEALSLLPTTQRWQVTFNTYFTGLNTATTCQWRFCTSDSEVLREVRGRPGVMILDLTQKMPPANGGRLVQEARSGQRQEVTEAVADTPKIDRQIEKEKKVALKPLPPRRPLVSASRHKQPRTEVVTTDTDAIIDGGRITAAKTPSTGQMLILLILAAIGVVLSLAVIWWCYRMWL